MLNKELNDFAFLNSLDLIEELHSFYNTNRMTSLDLIALFGKVRIAGS